jgi:hypothetical protein
MEPWILKNYSKCLATGILSYVGGKYLFAISIFLPKEVVTSRIEPETFTVVSDNDLPLQQQLRCVETRFLFYL